MNDYYKEMELEDQYINDPKYGIVYCNILPAQIEFFVIEHNYFQKEIPTFINGMEVTIVKVI